MKTLLLIVSALACAALLADAPAVAVVVCWLGLAVLVAVAFTLVRL